MSASSVSSGTAKHKKEQRLRKYLRACLPRINASGSQKVAAEELRDSTIEMLPRASEHTTTLASTYPLWSDTDEMSSVSNTKASWSLRKRRQYSSSTRSIPSTAFSSSSSSSTFSEAHKGVTYGHNGAPVHCRFCKILQSSDEPFLYEDENVVVFHPLAPVVSSHILVVPRRHIRNVNVLTLDDTVLLHQMREVAVSVLRKLPYSAVINAASSAELCSDKDINGSDFKFVFHLPPFNSIDHVHMHAFHTRNGSFGCVGSMKYRIKTWWCRSFDEVMTRLGLPDQVEIETLH